MGSWDSENINTVLDIETNVIAIVLNGIFLVAELRLVLWSRILHWHQDCGHSGSVLPINDPPIFVSLLPDISFEGTLFFLCH